ncbi:MAG: hypothetical protein ABIJ34_02630 [archaeon]
MPHKKIVMPDYPTLMEYYGEPEGLVRGSFTVDALAEQFALNPNGNSGEIWFAYAAFLTPRMKESFAVRTVEQLGHDGRNAKNFLLELVPEYVNNNLFKGLSCQIRTYDYRGLGLAYCCEPNFEAIYSNISLLSKINLHMHGLHAASDLMEMIEVAALAPTLEIATQSAFELIHSANIAFGKEPSVPKSRLEYYEAQMDYVYTHNWQIGWIPGGFLNYMCKNNVTYPFE